LGQTKPLNQNHTRRLQIIAVPFTLGQGELAQHAADHGRGVVVRKEALLRGDEGPLTRALMDVVVNNSSGFRRQVCCDLLGGGRKGWLGGQRVGGE